MKNALLSAAVVLVLVCAALSPSMNLSPMRNLPLVSNIFPSRNVGISGGPVPLTPQQAAAFAKAGKLELIARAAKARGDYAGAEAAYRAETQVPRCPVPPWTWIDLGLMLDYQGKRNQAFAAYQKGFPNGSGAWGNSPELAEAAARFGAMCEQRGLHANACECYYTSRRLANSGDMMFLDYTLDAKTTSSALVRSMLDIALGIALELDRPPPSPEAMAAFRAAVKLEPKDPRPWYFLAFSLRRAGKFAEAQAALQKASTLDVNGRLKAAVSKSLDEVYHRSREW